MLTLTRRPTLEDTKGPNNCNSSAVFDINEIKVYMCLLIFI